MALIRSFPAADPLGPLEGTFSIEAPFVPTVEGNFYCSYVGCSAKSGMFSLIPSIAESGLLGILG